MLGCALCSPATRGLNAPSRAGRHVRALSSGDLGPRPIRKPPFGSSAPLPPSHLCVFASLLPIHSALRLCPFSLPFHEDTRCKARFAWRPTRPWRSASHLRQSAAACEPSSVGTSSRVPFRNCPSHPLRLCSIPTFASSAPLLPIHSALRLCLSSLPSTRTLDGERPFLECCSGSQATCAESTPRGGQSASSRLSRIFR